MQSIKAGCSVTIWKAKRLHRTDKRLVKGKAEPAETLLYNST